MTRDGKTKTLYDNIDGENRTDRFRHRAGIALFHLGQIAYQEGDFEDAIKKLRVSLTYEVRGIDNEIDFGRQAQGMIDQARTELNPRYSQKQ